MTDLKPCPFCGGGCLYETRRNGYCDETPTMFCNSCKAVVTWEQVEEEGVNDETKAFVREHWNSRAERICDYKQAAEYWQRMYEETFVERTCHDTDANPWHFTCSVCGYEQNGYEQWNYCPNCGARVVE